LTECPICYQPPNDPNEYLYLDEQYYEEYGYWGDCFDQTGYYDTCCIYDNLCDGVSTTGPVEAPEFSNIGSVLAIVVVLGIAFLLIRKK